MQGIVRKMKTNHQSVVQYTLKLGEEEQIMNDLLGQQISLTYTGQIFCKDCGRKTKKSFSQGFCYPCFMNSPMASPCIIHPEKCQAHFRNWSRYGVGENQSFMYSICIPFIDCRCKSRYYSRWSNSTRWIDQGARQYDHCKNTKPIYSWSR